MRPGDFAGPRRSIISLLDELEIKYCDAYASFSGQDIDALYLPDDSVHFTRSGHGVVRNTLLGCEGARSTSKLVVMPHRR